MSDTVDFNINGDSVTVVIEGGALAPGMSIANEALNAAVAEAQQAAEDATTNGAIAGQAAGATAGAAAGSAAGAVAGSNAGTTAANAVVATKANVTGDNISARRTFRQNTGQGAAYSLGDIATGLSDSAYTAAVQTLANQAVTDGVGLYIPDGPTSGQIISTITLSKVIPIYGDGAGLLRTALNAPAFLFTNSVYTTGLTMGGFKVFNDVGTLTNQNSCLFQFEGTEQLVYVTFRNIYTTGMYASIVNNMGTYAGGGFGQESLLNHCLFDRIESFYHPSSINAKYGIWHKKGSGTGNVYRALAGNIARSGTIGGFDIATLPAHVRIDGGPGYVCGDLYADGQVSGLNAALISFDGTMNYLNQIRTPSNSQVDAQAFQPIRADPSNVNPIGSFLVESAIGGEGDGSSGVGLVTQTKWDQQGVHTQRCGVKRTSTTVGAKTFQACTIQMRQNDGCRVFLTAQGLIQGVAAGMAETEVLLKSDGTTITPRVVSSSTNPPAAGAGFFQFSYVVTGLSIVFSVSYTAAATNGSDVDIQTVVIGGNNKLTRGV